jgi:hypothetical protein
MKKLIFGCLICLGCVAKKSNTISSVAVVNEKGTNTSVPFTDGIPAYSGANVDYRRDGASLFHVKLYAPVVVGVASKPEKWGYFQFPNIGRKPNGDLQVKWNMSRDAIEAYGEDTFGSAASTDNGKSWQLQDSAISTGIVTLKNGNKLEIVNPKPIKVDDLKLPTPVGQGVENYRKSSFTFYRLHDLPASRQGVFLKRLKKGETEWKTEQADLYDPQAARYSLSGLFPIVWWGDIHIAKDGSLIAGVYPGFLINENGVADPRSGVFFYRSTDNGYSWKIQGRIPYNPNTTGDPEVAKRMGYTEPGFEVMADGTFICILRTTDGAGIGPMFASFSEDLGKTWTVPKILSNTGVLPRVLQLDNGITVLSSGRPGVQLRFSIDKGRTWSDAFEMLPYGSKLVPNELSGTTATVSDGYTGLLKLGKDRCILVYSDFNYATDKGVIRKAIKVREIQVKKN